MSSTTPQSPLAGFKSRKNYAPSKLSRDVIAVCVIWSHPAENIQPKAITAEAAYLF
jgi:hypothetical protein